MLISGTGNGVPGIPTMGYTATTLNCIDLLIFIIGVNCDMQENYLQQLNDIA